jgi:thioredoxin reductase (NADPH)
VLVHFTQEDLEKTLEFGSVLLAIGRNAVTEGVHLENAGVIVNPKNKKVIVDDNERSNAPHIWAIGDCADVRLELTPAAIKAGLYLARRLFAEGTLKIDYVNVPTTVFTPLEYGCVGYSEEAAYEIYGKDNIEVYHSSFTSLEWNFSEKRKSHIPSRS